MRTLVLTTASTLALAALGSTTVGAEPPGPVSLVVSTTFDNQPDEVISIDGVLAEDCATGTTDDTYFHAGPPDVMWPTPSGSATLQVGKVLHCASGDIDIRLVVRLDLMTQTTSGRWVAVGGTGAYEHVSGGGTITGSPFDGGIDDAYEGQLHGV